MSIQTSIETINGRLVTIIRKPFDPEWVREQLAIGIPVIVENEVMAGMFNRGFLLYNEVVGHPTGNHRFAANLNNNLYDGFWTPHHTDNTIRNTITILPALPRYPQPEDAALLYRYMAEGIYPTQTHGNYCVGVCRNASQTCDDGRMRITHAIDTSGNKIDVAIIDRKAGE